ncbi:MAG: monovalent cation/H+ antiporter complex subunit F [Desulfurococcaceae archaeon]
MSLLTKLALEILLGVYILSAILFMVRIIKGPTLFDRIVVVDSLSYDLAVFMALISAYTSRSLLALCIIPIALWAYTLDTYISWYVEQSGS